MFYNQAFPQYSINRCLTILVRASFIRTYTCLQQQASAAAAVLGVLAPAPTPVVATQLQQQQLPTVLAPAPAHVTPTVKRKHRDERRRRQIVSKTDSEDDFSEPPRRIVVPRSRSDKPSRRLR